EEPGDEPVTVTVVAWVNIPFTTRALRVGLNHKDKINALILVEGRGLQVAEILVFAPCSAIQARAGIALRIPSRQRDIEPTAAAKLVVHGALRFGIEVAGDEARARYVMLPLDKTHHLFRLARTDSVTKRHAFGRTAWGGVGGRQHIDATRERAEVSIRGQMG